VDPTVLEKDRGITLMPIRGRRHLIKYGGTYNLLLR